MYTYFLLNKTVNIDNHKNGIIQYNKILTNVQQQYCANKTMCLIIGYISV